MNIALHMPNAKRLAWWTRELRQLLPEHTVLPHDVIITLADVDIAVVWKPPPGWLASLPNLQLTISIGAGIDHIVMDPAYPENVPIVKTTGPEMIERMREYIVLHVLRFHRQLPLIQAQQAKKTWKSVITPTASQRQIGIMGMGGMGQAAATSIAQLGFTVRCWSRSPKKVADVESFYGNEQLSTFAYGTDILVCLLPLTDATEGILSQALFSSLAQGACLINAARGQHLVEKDLLSALKSGQLSYATLDVFHVEPLPESHAFWTHPQILVTPHVASLIDPSSGGRVIAENIERFARGEEPNGMTVSSQGF